MGGHEFRDNLATIQRCTYVHASVRYVIKPAVLVRHFKLSESNIAEHSLDQTLSIQIQVATTRFYKLSFHSTRIFTAA